MLPVAVGVIAGAAAAFGLSGVLDHFLYEVSSQDPFAFLAGAGVLLITGLVSALIPAVRASRSDPASALRSE
jgi:ABC-type antimicrobial peptide transport system permease subunit